MLLLLWRLWLSAHKSRVNSNRCCLHFGAGARGDIAHLSMVSTEVPYTVGRCKKRGEEEQGYKELLFLRAAGHVERMAGDTQGYPNANPTTAGTGSPGRSSCVDASGRTTAKPGLMGLLGTVSQGG